MNENLTEKQGINIITIFIIGSSLVIGTATDARKDMYLAVILGYIFAIPVVLIYSRLLLLYPGDNIYAINDKIFGKAIGTFINLLFIWYALHLGALVLRNFSEFIATVGLPDTPVLVPMIIFIIVCIIGVKTGLDTLGRYSDLMVRIVVLLIAMDCLLLIPKMRINNMLPVLEDGIKPLLKGGFEAFSFPFAETVVLLSAFSSLGKRKTVAKVYLYGLTCGMILISAAALRDVLVLSETKIEKIYFANYTATSLISIGDFFQRIEIIVSIVLVTAGFIKVCFCLFSVCKGITGIFNYSDYKFIAAPVGFLMLYLSRIIYGNIMQMFMWAKNIYPYYACLFQVILPIIVWIAAEIKTRNKRNKINA